MNDGTNYVNAPATKMLATHCAVCGRPLLDAQSVERGIGPDCYKHYYGGENMDAAAREKANAIVHKIALVQKGKEAFELCRELWDLDFRTLADRILDRLTKIQIEVDGDALLLWAPYDAAFVDATRSIKGRTWLKDKKATRFPRTPEMRAALCAALTKHFPGKWAKGPKGPFVVGDNDSNTKEEAAQ